MDNITEEIETKEYDINIFGFWVYLMTDLVIFAVLFACFVVLRDSTYGGLTSSQLFRVPPALAETLLLLTSSFTCSLGTLAIRRKQKSAAMIWFGVTFALGVAFLSLECVEFSKFITVGATPSRSAFLSSFFTLVGTHGLHITCGLLWMVVSMFHIGLRPLSPQSISKIFRMAFFWHFLDFVWIFIFTVVYGMGIL